MTIAMVSRPANTTSVRKCRPKATRKALTEAPKMTPPASAMASAEAGRAGRGDGPEGLRGLSGDEGAIPRAGSAGTPPGFEGVGARELLHVVRPRTAPILLQQQIAHEPRTDQEERSDRARSKAPSHLARWERRACAEAASGGQHQQPGNPVGDAADEVRPVARGERELGSVMVEEPIGDLQVQRGIGGEHDADASPTRNRCVATSRAPLRPPTQ